MPMDIVFDKNIKLWEAKNLASGLAIIAPGFAEHKDEKYLQALAQGFNQQGMHAITFDPSDFHQGNLPLDVSFNNYMKDIEKIHSWVKEHFYYKKIYLAGHSIGAAAAFQYALGKEGEIAGVVMLAPLLDQKIYVQESQKHPSHFFDKWKNEGALECRATNNQIYKVAYSFVENLKAMQVPKLASQNKVASLVIAATQDKVTPFDEIKNVANNMPNAKFSAINAGHYFKADEELLELKNTLILWLAEQKLEQSKNIMAPVYSEQKTYA